MRNTCDSRPLLFDAGFAHRQQVAMRRPGSRLVRAVCLLALLLNSAAQDSKTGQQPLAGHGEQPAHVHDVRKLLSGGIEDAQLFTRFAQPGFKSLVSQSAHESMPACVFRPCADMLVHASEPISLRMFVIT